MRAGILLPALCLEDSVSVGVGKIRALGQLTAARICSLRAHHPYGPHARDLH